MIAIALACGPTLLFADEPTTALDVTVQAQILELIGEQRRDRNMSVILVTHDLGVVAGHTDEIAVMYGGRLVEKAPTRQLFANMKMPYTKSLMRSIPKIEDPSHTRLLTIPGRPPDLVNPPKGCGFAPRCAYARERCLDEQPPLVPTVESDAALVRLLVSRRFPGVRGARRGDHVEGRRRRSCRLMAGTGNVHLRDGDAVLRVEDLVVEFPIGRTRHGQRRRGHQLRRDAGRDARHRRRVRLRQVDDRSGDHADRAAHVRLRRVRGPGPDRPAVRGAAGGPDEDPDDLPGPDLVVEPSPQGARQREGAARHLGPRYRSRTRRRRRCRARERRDRPRSRRREPAAPVLRWAVPAHLDRPGARARPDADHLRRAGIGARRECAGTGAEPAGGPQGRVRPDADVHRPRPRRREEHQRPRGSHVPGQAVRGRDQRRPLRSAGASVHERPARVDPDPRSGNRGGGHDDPG